MKNKPLIGIALGSGSARGYAHIGVLQVLNEEIPFDMVAGSSMGALVGALYVTGTDLNMLGRLAGELSSKMLWDMSISRKGFIKGERIYELISMLTKGKSFEETDIPFYCVACDIATGEAVVFDTGKIADGVRASISIPGIFVPFEHEGRMLVDGGVLYRVPAQVLQEAGSDIVIGVDVGYCGEQREQPVGAVEIIQYTMDIMGWEGTRHCASHADILIRPKVRHLSSASFKKPQEFIEAGRLAAQEALPDIRALIGRKAAEIEALAQMA
ncbi:MAG: patatin-like phospholipase family protein [Christensenellales bacterium]|jgi:NTE family protein